MWKRSVVVVLVTTVALALWAYHTNTGQPDNPQAAEAGATVSADETRHKPETSAPPYASPSEPAPRPTPSPEPTMTTMPTALGTPAHQDTEAAPADALDTVTRFAAAYLTPGDKTSKQWVASLTPLVTKELAHSLATVDVSNVPSGTVTTVAASSSSSVAITTTVETSRGPMLILTTWSGTRWEISRYTPPES